MIRHFGLAVTAAAVAVSGVSVASAHPLPTHHFGLDAYGHRGRPLRPPTYGERRWASTVWTPVTATPPFGNNGAGTAVLLTDGTVLIHDNFSSWYKLTPDAYGNYINGTWSQVASLPSGYGPLYFADAVLPDGRVAIEGGEYNFDRQVETTQGAIYDPIANTWTSVAPPTGWSSIGDAQGVVLANGTWMIGNCCSSAQALFNATNLTWTLTGSGKEDANSEEGWALLPNGGVLTVDVENRTPRQSEIYNPSTGAWSNAGDTRVVLPDYTEIGPEVLRPDGDVFATGASGKTAIYETKRGKWKPGPTFPTLNGQQLDIADGAGCLLPDGNVLVVASPGAYATPSEFFEYNGKALIAMPGTPNAPQDSSYDFRMLALPNGQVLSTDGTNDVEIYTNGGNPKKAWAPVIDSVATTLTHGTTYSVSGVYLNGFSQAGAYGDDAQAATNYPLVRITNTSTGHVFYARTHDHSSMAVASPAVVTTNFDVPASIDLGASMLQVVANGVASRPVAVTIQ